MATILFEEIKEKTNGLTEIERQHLVEFLLADAKETRKKKVSPNILWLKQHRDEVAGKYVALENGKLFGQGKTLREAENEAAQNGAQKPLLTYIPAADEDVFGGW